MLCSNDDALFFVRGPSDSVPPFSELLSQFHDDLWMLIDDIGLLKRISLQIIKLTILQETPPFPEHASLISSHLSLTIR